MVFILQLTLVLFGTHFVFTSTTNSVAQELVNGFCLIYVLQF